VLEIILKTAGRVLAHLPEALLRGLAAGLGDLLFFCLPRRRQLVLSNLHHAFEDRPAHWHRAIGRESCRRLIETALLSLAMPFLPERRLRGMLRASPPLAAALATQRPTLFVTAHLCCWESQTMLPLLVPAPFPEFGVVFRPLDNPAADAWVKRSRERFGMRLLSQGGFSGCDEDPPAQRLPRPPLRPERRVPRRALHPVRPRVLYQRAGRPAGGKIPP
jgi:lauroyl/myristoyl acyltransferase